MKRADHIIIEHCGIDFTQINQTHAAIDKTIALARFVIQYQRQ